MSGLSGGWLAANCLSRRLNCQFLLIAANSQVPLLVLLLLLLPTLPVLLALALALSVCCRFLNKIKYTPRGDAN